MTYRIVNPEPLGEPRGWNHGLLAPADGRVLFVAGQTAAEPDGSIAPDFAAQFERVLEKVLSVVQEAGGAPEHVGRMTVWVTSLPAYRRSRKELGEAWRRTMGRHYPAVALVEVSGLVDPGAQVEIEATAVIPARAAAPETEPRP